MSEVRKKWKVHLDVPHLIKKIILQVFGVNSVAEIIIVSNIWWDTISPYTGKKMLSKTVFIEQQSQKATNVLVWQLMFKRHPKCVKRDLITLKHL